MYIVLSFDRVNYYRFTMNTEIYGFRKHKAIRIGRRIYRLNVNFRKYGFLFGYTVFSLLGDTLTYSIL